MLEAKTHCDDRFGTARLVVALLAMATVAMIIWAIWGAQSESNFRYDWLVAAVCSRLFAVCGAVLCGGMAATILLVRMLWRAGRAGRKRRRSQDGTALLEFTLVLPILLTLVLVMIQSSLLMGGNLCVHYAAFCAARSAITHVPAYYGESEPANVVDAPLVSRKMRTIREAAAWALMPVSCGDEDYPASDELLAGGMAEFFSSYGREAPSWLDDRIARKFQYAMDHTDVELAEPDPLAEGDDPAGAYATHEILHVKLRHVLYLSVPYANWLFRQLDRQGGVDLDFRDGEYGLLVQTRCSLTNEGPQDFVDVEQFDQSPVQE